MISTLTDSASSPEKRSIENSIGPPCGSMTPAPRTPDTQQSSRMRAGTLFFSQQTAGCNAAHTVESRLARCLLQTHDLSGGSKLYLTQESLAQMIGARRNSVSLVASTLQQANFIHYSRGHIEITDLEGLSKTACECYASVKTQYERLLRPHCTAEEAPRTRAG